ncbi:hypothetical protein JTB14_009566 [Gonioctena quinquepunctata]|nr:hypothetical protein JTB14_009566 [Gonioctena quinquepunctata]
MVKGKLIHLGLEEILKESISRQTTSNESIIEQNSSTGGTPANQTGDKISEEAEEVIVNADFGNEHNWDLEKEEADNSTPEMGAGPELESELLIADESSIQKRLRE